MDLEHTEETEIHGAILAPAEITEELPPTPRQQVAEAILHILQWVIEEKPNRGIEHARRRVHLRALAAIHVLAPESSQHESLNAIARITGVSIPRVCQIAADAKRQARITLNSTL